MLLPNTTPPAIRLLVRHCLQKNRRDRLHHIGDARIAIIAAKSDGSGVAVEPRSRTRRLAWIAATLLVGTLVAAGVTAGAGGADNDRDRLDGDSAVIRLRAIVPKAQRAEYS